MGLHPSFMGIPQPGFNLVHLITMQTQSLPSHNVDFPRVIPWLKYCDQHPNCHGDSLSDYAHKSDQEGYCCIDQLTSNWVSVEKLAGWVKIRMGIAELVVCYTNKDMVLNGDNFQWLCQSYDFL